MGLLRGKICACALSQPGALLLIALVTFQFSVAVGQNPVIFQYGYSGTEALSLSVQGDGNAQISPIGYQNITCLGDMSSSGSSFDLRGNTTTNVSGKCLYKNPVPLTAPCSCALMLTSFSTMFQVSISSILGQVQSGTVQGLAFIIGSEISTQGAGGGYLGWLNSTTNNASTGHNFAVEIDFFQDPEFQDPVNVHVGVDVNSLTSVTTSLLVSGLESGLISELNETGDIKVRVWIEYDGLTSGLQVFVSWSAGSVTPFKSPTPIISTNVDLNDTFSTDGMFVGISGSILTDRDDSEYTHYQFGPWTFNSDGPAPDLPLYNGESPGGPTEFLSFQSTASGGVTLGFLLAICSVLVILMLLFRRRIFIFLVNLVFVIKVLYRQDARLSALARKLEMEEGALGRGPQHFQFRELSVATKGFNSSELLGSGGFGSVYRGSLKLKGEKKPTEVAVKRISATSDQGAQEFLAEVKIIGQVRQRNLVRLLGWCHERAELLLVYEYMPNGSLDHHLYKRPPGEPSLTWARRLKITSGVATALAYLHEEWEQRVIHRDVKSSNVMLDNDFNARLGDFGLARLSEHGQAPPSTMVLAGTYGYLAPELVNTLKPTEKTDVYSFGAVVLEVATGKRPVLSREDSETLNEISLVHWVWGLYRDDALLDAADPTLNKAYDPGEMIMFLKIGLLCSHPNPDERPNMREVINIWKGSSPFPPLPRSKPIPVFRFSTDCSEPKKDQEGDPTASFFTANYGQADESGMITAFTLDPPDSHSAVLLRSPRVGDSSSPEKGEIHKVSSPNLTLRHRPRSTVTSLPF